MNRNAATTAATASSATATSTTASARAEALRFNFISCLIITAQNGFLFDVDPFVALCHETWDEEILWDAVKDLAHGAQQRTRLMHAAFAGKTARLRWLLARGAQLERRDASGRTALWWACSAGREGAARELLTRGACIDAEDGSGVAPLLVALKRAFGCGRGAGAPPPAAERHVALLRALLERAPPRLGDAVDWLHHFEPPAREGFAVKRAVLALLRAAPGGRAPVADPARQRALLCTQCGDVAQQRRSLCEDCEVAEGSRLSKSRGGGCGGGR